LLTFTVVLIFSWVLLLDYIWTTILSVHKNIFPDNLCLHQRCRVTYTPLTCTTTKLKRNVNSEQL
jgi:hypothetical protein